MRPYPRIPALSLVGMLWVMLRGNWLGRSDRRHKDEQRLKPHTYAIPDGTSEDVP
jgi:hypothetical protein